MADYLGVKIMESVGSDVVSDHIDWCKSKDTDFVVIPLPGVKITGKSGSEIHAYTKEQIAANPIVTINGVDVDLSEQGVYPSALGICDVRNNIATGFFFKDPKIAMEFKLKWGGIDA